MCDYERGLRNSLESNFPMVESFNKRFSEGVGHSNPTIWNFISAMQLEQSMTDTKQTAVLVDERPPKRLAKSTRRDDRVLSSINNMVF